MNFNEFTTRLVGTLQEHFGTDSKVKLQEVQKNNGVIKHGVTILENGINISPTIYIDEWYDSFCNNKCSFQDIIDRVIQSYEHNKLNQSVDIGFFTNFDKVKSRIIYRLVNTEKNKELLKDIPSIPFHDLSIVFYYLVDTADIHKNATILLHNAHLALWNISVDGLYDLAKENTPVLKRCKIENMKNVVQQMIEMTEDKDAAEEFFRTEFSEENAHMYVLSCEDNISGASALLYPFVLRDFSYALHDDVIILPSSIHETILLPATENKNNIAELLSMVKEINETQVDEEEVLSDNIYYYDRAENKVTLLSKILA